MVANISRLVCRAEYFLILLAACGLLILPRVTCQSCNSQRGEPLIKISSTPSSNELRVGASIKLTCTAWQTDELTMRSPEKRPYTIYWYDPQDKRVGERCQAGLPAAKEMSCSLMVGPLTKKQFGFYTCKAINGYKECSNKRFEINLEDSRRGMVLSMSSTLRCFPFAMWSLILKMENESNETVEYHMSVDDTRSIVAKPATEEITDYDRFLSWSHGSYSMFESKRFRNRFVGCNTEGNVKLIHVHDKSRPDPRALFLIHRYNSGTYETERSEAAEDTGTEDGCDRSLTALVVLVLIVCDPAEQHEENNAFKLARKFWYIAR
ncbi:hypothetical protein OS493_030233 [Desmophyllum pertusum]|uniref:Ig-like domain-containing protein n=1 Tax=Desmophyllum pertusum TaxID=174260 RepID=A0A9W9Y8Q4_9CNID|nr:hypothetical protein OS493_030233 [Desmophyllum pertusum]